jgi:predicted nucleic acid-binding protein
MTIRQATFMVDSNILVYAFDASNLEKQSRAVAVLESLRAGGRAGLSVQALGEFYNAATRRIPVPLTALEAEQSVQAFAAAFPTFETTVEAVVEGARAVRQYKLSTWDAVTWAVCRLSGGTYLLSEDLGHNQVIEGVRILNPLRSDFDLALIA